MNSSTTVLSPTPVAPTVSPTPLPNTATPTRRVSVRWSSERSCWCIVEASKPETILEEITSLPAYLTDVTFDAQTVQQMGRGFCGASLLQGEVIVGLATGNLVFERPAVTQDSHPCNLSFKDGAFYSCSTVVTSARAVRLSSERFATIWR